MRNLILFFTLAACLLTACVTERSAIRWFDNNPAQAAKYALEKFPPDTAKILIPGKEVHHYDTTYLPDTIPVKVACPPNLPDTEYIPVKVPVKVPEYRERATRTDTVVRTIVRYEYKALYEDLKRMYDEQTARLIKQYDRAEKYRKKARNADLRTAGLIFLLLIGFVIKKRSNLFKI